jgi:RimJ/RimL family protein N-acetyltransferase
LAILPELRTQRLTLRRFTLDDAPFVLQLVNDPAFIANIGDKGVRSIDDARRYLTDGPLAMYRQHGFGLWHTALTATSEAVGMCGLLRRDVLPDVDLGYAYLPQHRGQGLAQEAARAVLAEAGRRFGLRRVVAVVSQGNQGSIRVLEKLGMRFEGLHAMYPGEPEVRLYSIATDAGVTGA